MKLHGMDWAAAAVLIGAGWAAIYAGVQRSIRRAVTERQQEMERQVSALAMTVKALQARVAELGRQRAAQEGEVGAISAAESERAAKERPAKPEIVAALTAAATAFLGKKARVGPAQLTPADQEGAGAWAQQGRVIVQTSHNLRSRG